MELAIKSVRFEDGEIRVVPENRPMARMKVGEANELLRKNKRVAIKLDAIKQKRSLNANAYAWVLIDRIAAALGIDKVEVYRDAIRDIGGNSDVVMVANDAVDKLRAVWEARGLGWSVEVTDRADTASTVLLHYGSSTYDTRQMTLLIDHLVQDAKELGIETLPPDRLAGMIERWR